MFRSASDEPAVDLVTVIDADSVDVVARAGGRRWLFLVVALVGLAVVAVVLSRRSSSSSSTDDELAAEADALAGIAAPQPGAGPSEAVPAPS